MATKITKGLILKFKDNRLFFTEQKNFSLLIETCRTFGADMLLVELKEPATPLSINSLCRRITSKNDPPKLSDYKVIEIKLVPPHAQPSASPEQIEAYIRQYVTKKSELTLNEVCQEFPTTKRSLIVKTFACLRKQMSKEGCAWFYKGKKWQFAK